MSDDLQFEIKGGYRTVYNQIVQPDRVFTVSRYFLDYWLPLLSPSLAWLIVAFRQRAFWNGQRDWCIVSQDRIAREAGISSRTARRQLSSAYMAWFLSGQARRRFRPDLGRKVYDISSYVVYQDDPLVPQHQAGLAALLAGAGGGAPTGALHALLQLPAAQLLARLDDPGAASSPGLVKGTVKAVVEHTCDLAVDEAGLTELCDRLHHHITAADKVYVGTQYFRTEWLPKLGPALAWLVVALRNDIFYNEQTGESRLEVTYPKQELAAAIGQTPRNLLNLVNHRLAGVFFEINQQKSNTHTLTLKVRPWQGTQEALTPEDRQFVELSGYTPETADQLNSAKDVLADSVSAAATGVESPANEPEILANGNVEKRPVEGETNRKSWPMKAKAEILSARNEEKAPVEADELGKLAGTNRKNGPMEGKLEILADGNTEKEPVEGETNRKFWPMEAEVEKLAAGNQENGTVEDGEPEKMLEKNRKSWPMEGKAEILADGNWNESALEGGKAEILAAGNAEKGPVEGDINRKYWPEGKPEILAAENQEEPSSNEPKVEILADGNQEKEAVEGGENQKIRPVEEGKAEILADGNRKFWPLEVGKPEILAEHAQPQTGKNVRTQEDSLKTHGFKKTQQQQRFAGDVVLSDWLDRLGQSRGLRQQVALVQELLAATSGQSLAASRISPLVEQYGARALAVAVYETGTLEGASARLSREPGKTAAGRSTPGLAKKQIRFYMQQLQIVAPTCNELAELAWIHQPGYLATWAAWFAGQHKYGPGWVVEQIRSELWPPQQEAAVAEVLRCYETEIGLITPALFSEILNDIEAYDLHDRELWSRAFERAVDQDVQEWASIRQMYLELRQEATSIPPPETSRAGPAPLAGEWQVVLEILRGGMTRATYETIVQNNAWPIGRQNGSLVISVASSQAWEWLENRWKPAVERAVKIAFGEELRVEFRLEAADDPGA